MLTKIVRNIVSNGGEYTFYPASRIVDKVHDGAGLYLHVPFCEGSCPYCPYFKVSYNKTLVEQFSTAVMSEIDAFVSRTGRFGCSSLYVGGGTPTLMIDKLGRIIDRIRDAIDLNGCIAVETTPADITVEKSRLLKKMGVSHVSLGVQSFHNKYLDLLGRKYNSVDAKRAAIDLSRNGFDTLNIDLIFAMPNETQQDLEVDLRTAVDCTPDQITCYPLFTFPYSTIGHFKKLRKLQMPPVAVRRRMYYFIHDFLEGNGYSRSSVWSFTRTNAEPYSSVTRDHYIGFGPSSATYTGEAFYFNTFSIRDYLSLGAERNPVALKMDVTERMAKVFWLYWRLYETKIPYKEYKELFGRDICDDFGFLLAMIRALGMCAAEDKHGLTLNRRGSYWIHLAQNYFALDYVNKIWSKCQSEPWPEKIVL